MKNLENMPADSLEQPEDITSEEKIDTAEKRQEQPEFKKDLEALKEQEKQAKTQARERGYEGVLSKLSRKGRKFAGVAVLSLASFSAGCGSEAPFIPDPVLAERAEKARQKFAEFERENAPIEVPIAPEEAATLTPDVFTPTSGVSEKEVAAEKEEKKEEKQKEETTTITPDVFTSTSGVSEKTPEVAAEKEEIKITPEEMRFTDELSFTIKESKVSALGNNRFSVDLGHLGLYEIGLRRAEEIMKIQKKYEALNRGVKQRGRTFDRLEEVREYLKRHMESDIKESIREETNLRPEAEPVLNKRTVEEEKAARTRMKEKAREIKIRNAKINR